MTRPILSPAAIESMRVLRRRRSFMVFACLLTYVWLARELVAILASAGWSAMDFTILACFLVAAPWTVLGFWNALVGIWLTVRQGAAPRALDRFQSGEFGLSSRTAVLMTVRNEDIGRAIARLAIVKQSLDEHGQSHRFHYFLLSDTSQPALMDEEEAAFARWQEREGADSARLHYRRRPSNSGHKAGNLRDFCEKWRSEFELMVVLDADSLMTGEKILGMVRTAVAYPRVGIVQSLVVGMPTMSAFGRLFQFGMRHGMRPYSLASAWWAGDCSQFWGHNAVVRIGPFVDHCQLPVLTGRPPFGGEIMSHDQVEAVLMRKAGYEVRVLPVEGGSYEDNPPNLSQFIRRDLRWCQGNMQYLSLLDMPGLALTSRFQLVWAIMLFVGVAAWTLLIAATAMRPLFSEWPASFAHRPALLLYITFFLMSLVPKLAGFFDVGRKPQELHRYGGATRFALGCICELAFSLLLSAITTFRTACFLAALCFGRSIGWASQTRDAQAQSWQGAVASYWPQTIFGTVIMFLLARQGAALAIWSLPLTAGYVLAIPFAVVTSSKRLGQWMASKGICGIPEEFEPVAEIEMLKCTKVARA